MQRHVPLWLSVLISLFITTSVFMLGALGTVFLFPDTAIMIIVFSFLAAILYVPVATWINCTRRSNEKNRIALIGVIAGLFFGFLTLYGQNVTIFLAIAMVVVSLTHIDLKVFKKSNNKELTC